MRITTRTSVSDRQVVRLSTVARFDKYHERAEKVWSEWFAGKKNENGERNTVLAAYKAGVMSAVCSGLGIVFVGSVSSGFNAIFGPRDVSAMENIKQSFASPTKFAIDSWEGVISYAVDHPTYVATIYLTAKVFGKIIAERRIRTEIIKKFGILRQEIEELRAKKDDILATGVENKGYSIPDIQREIVNMELDRQLTNARNNGQETREVEVIKEDFRNLRIGTLEAAARLSIDLNEMTIDRITRSIDESIEANEKTMSAGVSKLNPILYGSFALKKVLVATNILYMHEVIEAASNAYHSPSLSAGELGALTGSLKFALMAWAITPLEKFTSTLFLIPRGLIVANIIDINNVINALSNWYHAHSLHGVADILYSLKYLIASGLVRLGIGIYNKINSKNTG